MESNLADAFASKVNCNTDTAYSFLHANSWDLDKAILNWHDTQEESTPDEPEQEINGKNDVKKLSRGISRATDNVNLVSKTRCEFAQNFKQSPASQILTFIESTGYSFTLPDLMIYGEDFIRFLEKDLIDKNTLLSLEESKRLNWWADSTINQNLCDKLWPLITTGDGNCLLHAASLAIWGFHDRLLTLREALHEYLDKNVHMEILFRRWRWHSMKQNELFGFTSTEEQMSRDWRNIINMASAEPRNLSAENGDSKPKNNNIYESLEEFHVLALAHILRRPIIVIADIMLKDMNNQPFSPIHFGGIYLPFECSPKECHRSPLLLTFDRAHFSALVPMENVDKNDKERLSLIPLTDSEGMLLPVQFCVDPGPTFNWDETYEQSFINSLLLSEKDQIGLLRKYLDVVDLSEQENLTGSPEVDSEDEIERKFVEIQDFNDGEISIFCHKNRAAKQLQSVARQFGSIGKSMSKKLKKNFGSITKPKQKRNDTNKNRLICAEIHAKRHENHEQMIKNYLTHIQKKFLSGNQRLKSNGASTESMRLQQQAYLEGPMKCINSDCHDFGTVLTSYMCEKCYEAQRNQELNVNSDSRIATGKSKFYRDTDFDSYDAVKRLPVHRPIYQQDQTLYLLKSTFYYDNDKPENNNQMIETPRIEDISEDIDLDNRRKKYLSRSPNNPVTNYNKENYLPENYHQDNSSNKSRHIVQMDVTLSNASKNATSESNGIGNSHEKRTPFTQNNLNHLINDTVQNVATSETVKKSIYKDDPNGSSLIENKYVSDDILRLSALPDRHKSNQYKTNYNSPSPSSLFAHNSSYENGCKHPLLIENEHEFFDRVRFPHLQQCKTNSCSNIASEHTNFYCTDCWKTQQF